MTHIFRWAQVEELTKSKSKYAFPKYGLLFSETIAKSYQPIIYSHECLSGSPEAVYHRILAKEKQRNYVFNIFSFGDISIVT
jgi:hypothetical protein